MFSLKKTAYDSARYIRLMPKNLVFKKKKKHTSKLPSKEKTKI